MSLSSSNISTNTEMPEPHSAHPPEGAIATRLRARRRPTLPGQPDVRPISSDPYTTQALSHTAHSQCHSSMSDQASPPATVSTAPSSPLADGDTCDSILACQDDVTIVGSDEPKLAILVNPCDSEHKFVSEKEGIMRPDLPTAASLLTVPLEGSPRTRRKGSDQGSHPGSASLQEPSYCSDRIQLASTAEHGPPSMSSSVSGKRFGLRIGKEKRKRVPPLWDRYLEQGLAHPPSADTTEFDEHLMAIDSPTDSKPDSKTEDLIRLRSGRVIEEQQKPKRIKQSPLMRMSTEQILHGHMDLVDMGTIADEEDAYLAQVTLNYLCANATEYTFSSTKAYKHLYEQQEGQEKPDIHELGSSRAQGMMRITPQSKIFHVPARREEAVSEPAHPVIMGGPSREARAAKSRRQHEERQNEVPGMPTLVSSSSFAGTSAGTSATTGTAAGTVTSTGTAGAASKTLRTCQKAIRFGKSRIHDWGLFALEPIAPRQMVIEYIGEVVRQQVANERERRYEHSGQFSTYLFRVDDDLVVDATLKGNTARLMNHSCRPNCSAHIAVLGGRKRIVVYAKEWIIPGQELTYDYKLAREAGQEPMRCLCGATGCRGFL